MAWSDIWGGALAGQQFQQNEQTLQQEQLKTDFMRAEQPIELADAQQKLQSGQIDLKVKQNELAASEDFAKLLRTGQQSGAAPGAARSPSDMMAMWGDVLSKHGLGQDSIEAYTKSAELANKTADTTNKQASAYAVHSETLASMLDGGANSDAVATYLHTQAPELLQSNPQLAQAVQATLDNPALLDTPYKGTTLRHFIAATLHSQQDRLDAAAKQARTQADAAYARETDEKVRMDRMLLGEDADVNAARRKAGDQPLPRSKASIPALAAAAIAHNVVLPTNDAERLATLREWQRENPGMDADAIMTKVAGQRAASPRTGSAGFAAGQFQRVMIGGKEAIGDVSNIMQGPISTIGFAGVTHEISGLSGMTKSTLGRKISGHDARQMAIKVAGLQRSLASIEAGGLAQGMQAFSEQLGPSVTPMPGDDLGNVLTKMAQARQITINGLTEMLSNPQLSPDQKQDIRGMIQDMRQAVPFSVHDVDQLYAGKYKSLAEAAQAAGLGIQPDKGGFVPGQRYTDAHGNSAVYKGNGQWQTQ